MNRTEHELELMRLYLEGVASLEETQELESLIVKDASVRQDFLRYTHLDSALVGVRRSQPSVVAPRPSVWLSWRPLAAACAAFLALGAWWFQRDAVPMLSGTISDFTGVVELVSAGQRMVAKNKFAISEGDELSLGDGVGVVTLRFRDEATFLVLHGGSRVVMTRLSEGKVIELREGLLSAEVAHQPAGQPMLLRTPLATATVLGTAFEIGVRDGMTGLKVTQGVVNLSAPDESSVEVQAGGNAVAGPGEPVRPVTYDAVRAVPDKPSGGHSHIVLATGEERRFSFDQSAERWYLIPPSKWSAVDRWDGNGVEKSAAGVIDLLGDATYQVLGPTFQAAAGDAFSVDIFARFEADALLTARFYIFHDTILKGSVRRSQIAVPPIAVPTHGGGTDFQHLRFSFTVPAGHQAATSIAPVLYKRRSDGTAPQPGGRIVIDEITVKRE